VPKQLRSLDRLVISNPCNADWDAMSGNDRVRFCEHCELSVTNLSRMTRYEAMRLVARSQGRLCVRFVQGPGGKILATAPEKIYRISRRVSRITAGAFTAALSLSTAAAQNSSISPGEARRETAAVMMPAVPREPGAGLSGVITDPTGAVVAGANVTLTNAQTKVAFTYTTGDDGAYKFSLLEGGTYSLVTEAEGFAKAEKAEVNLPGYVDHSENVVLQIPTLIAEVEVTDSTEVFVSVQGGISFREPEESLVKAALKNDLAEVGRLATTGTDVNVIDKTTDMSALAFAVQNGNRDMVNLLLSASANPNLVNVRGETPLIYLGQNATAELVQVLLSAGADVNARDHAGATALITLGGSGKFEAVKLLLDAGADIRVEDKDGNTALMSAAQNKILNCCAICSKQV
jgi:hypothetical protein